MGVKVYDAERMIPRHRDRMDAQEGSVGDFMSAPHDKRPIACGQKLLDLRSKHGLRGFHFLPAADNVTCIEYKDVIRVKGKVA